MSSLCYSILLFLIFCLFISPSSAHASDEEGDHQSEVVVLTDSNFDELTSEGSWLLEFYAPWCGHCKKLSPIFDETARKLKLQGSKMYLGKIDATQEKMLAGRYDIKSYPTLKFKRGSELRPYNGGRTTEAFLSFAAEMSGPAVTPITSAKQMKTLTNRHPIIFSLFGPSAKSDAALKAFNEVAFRLQGTIKFVHVPTDGVTGNPSSQDSEEDNTEEDNKGAKLAKKLLKKYSIDASELPSVVVLTNGGDLEEFTGPWDVDSVRDFVWKHRFPLISDLDGSNFEDLTNDGKYLVLLCLDPKSDRSAPYIDAALSVAKKFKGQVLFATVDSIKFSGYVSQFGIDTANELPSTFILDYPDYYFSSKSIYPQGPLPASHIEELVSAAVEGRISSQGTTPWYNPSRYFKILERWLNKLSTGPFIAVITAFVLAFTSCIFFVCKFLIGLEGEEGELSEDGNNNQNNTQNPVSATKASGDKQNKKKD